MEERTGEGDERERGERERGRDDRPSEQEMRREQSEREKRGWGNEKERNLRHAARSKAAFSGKGTEPMTNRHH